MPMTRDDGSIVSEDVEPEIQAIIERLVHNAEWSNLEDSADDSSTLTRATIVIPAADANEMIGAHTGPADELVRTAILFHLQTILTYVLDELGERIDGSEDELLDFFVEAKNNMADAENPNVTVDIVANAMAMNAALDSIVLEDDPPHSYLSDAQEAIIRGLFAAQDLEELPPGETTRSITLRPDGDDIEKLRAGGGKNPNPVERIEDYAHRHSGDDTICVGLSHSCSNGSEVTIAGPAEAIETLVNEAKRLNDMGARR